jgi:hypothetical protein
MATKRKYTYSKGSRVKKQAGGALLVPPEQEDISPIDDVSIPIDSEEAIEASQVPDEKMESDYLDFIVDEALDDEEQIYLTSKLEEDPRLSQIFDKVIGTASEFSGEGEVEGPGTAVSDSIPARLSEGEFVFTNKATEQIGPDNLQEMMDEAERAYDGGLMSKAFGGTIDTKSDEEIRKQMISSGQNLDRIPNLR